MKEPVENMTTAQVAQVLNLTTRAVQNLAKAGRFPGAVKLPGKTSTYLIPRSDVLAEQKRRQSIQKTD